MNKHVESLKNINLSLPEFLKLSHARESHALDAICYFSEPLTGPSQSPIGAPLIRVAMPPLGDIKADSAASPLRHVTERAHQQIFGLLAALDYPFIGRLWNYMANINGHSHNLERCRQFNLGRQGAFMACRRDIAGNVPAACALGTVNGPLMIAFLAGKQSPLAMENPRQVSAYDYPPHCGPRSPTFSRASLVRLGADEVLWISGTASIVGHRTTHPGDVQEQTRETLTNIEAVMRAANLQVSRLLFSLSKLLYRVYVRHSADVAAVQQVMLSRLGARFNAVFLQADVCRQNLLMEIEASALLPR